MYTITVENCNSIEKAEIAISEGVLNIKYGPNGLGKSTIARAIVASVMNDGSLQNLKPFKHRGAAGQHEPAARVKVVVASFMQPTVEYCNQPNAT